MAKITKFGTITEAENGDLVFDGFSFDMEFEGEGGGVELIGLIIDRLKEGLDPDTIEINEV